MRTACSEDADFSPAEAVFGSQLILPGQFLSTPEPPSPNFLQEFQGLLAGRSPRQTSHHTTPLPVSLPEDLLLSRFVLVRRDAVQPPLSPLYDGPYLVLERSLHFFKVQIGSRIETVSTHRLKPCHTPEDAQAAEPPRRGRPPNAAEPPKVVRHTLSGSRQPKKKTPPRLLCQPGRYFRAAAPASAACAARQSRPPAPLNCQTSALYSLRTNRPSCKNADVESPTLKYPERTLCKKIWRKPNKKSQ